ncbi:hypothetical protein BSL82_09505 [Tardibacter chloracetimidivorans]|uniref:Uncharacterized protein n=1 Tax=Tardibacter chloracetimidivorans TaxID=1921510 RepID=A0A1L3ZV33_9SPHN|nr:hypothetical protein BSL82_09505 [Tardibacter chloracetimidivorans]
MSVRNAGAVGDALSDVGQTVANTGFEMQEAEDQLQAARARSQYLTEKIALDSEVEQDQDHETLEKRYTERLNKIGQTTAQMIRSPRARALYEQDIKTDAARGMATIKSHVFTKKKDAGRAGLAETMQTNREAALASPNEADATALLESTTQAITAAREAGYISVQEEVSQRQQFVESYAKGRLTLLPDAKQVETLTRSLETDKTGTWTDFIPRDQREVLRDQAATRLRAEERARRAEQKLIAQEEIDEAEEIARLTSDGVPVPQDQIDRAIKVAEANSKDALAYRLRVSGLKTKLSTEYKASTPSELQDDINALSAKITQSGGSAELSDIVARDHLITLKNNAQTALNDDPLSWAAGAWGVEIPPLNWDDPRTLGERLRLARTVSKRTGAPVRPLTDEEADGLKVELDRGAAGKLEVLEQVKAFGPTGAVAAARQIAPDDGAFRIAAGLSTLPSTGAAKNVSRDIIIGEDALKANPGLWDKQEADRIAGEIATPAMRLLPPDMRAGVLDAAKNIYATRLSRIGAARWQGQDWPQAISAALGGYKDSAGTMRGGLGSWKGEMIILPTGVSQTEMDTAIARADETKFALAGGGKPVWSNGAPVPLSRLKQMDLVAEGDGVYRLFDGRGFIAREDGQPFRLDVRKLR